MSNARIRRKRKKNRDQILDKLGNIALDRTSEWLADLVGRPSLLRPIKWGGPPVSIQSLKDTLLENKLHKDYDEQR